MPGWFGALIFPYPNGQFLVLGGVRTLARMVCEKSAPQCLFAKGGGDLKLFGQCPCFKKGLPKPTNYLIILNCDTNYPSKFSITYVLARPCSCPLWRWLPKHVLQFIRSKAGKLSNKSVPTYPNNIYRYISLMLFFPLYKSLIDAWISHKFQSVLTFRLKQGLRKAIIVLNDKTT